MHRRSAAALELSAAGKRVLLLESGGRASAPETQELSRADVLDRKVHDDMTICVSRQLGGTSNLWGARCQPLDPVDFSDRSAFAGASWPIGLEDIAPYYEKAADYAHCGKAVFRDPLDRLDQADGRVVGTRLERFSNRPAFQKSHAATLESDPNIEVRLNATVTGITIADEGHAVSVTVCRPDGKKAEVPVASLALASQFFVVKECF